MKYDIYFHNDFDGRASAAVLLNFLRSRGNDIGHFAPVSFDLEAKWLDKNFFEKHELFKGRRNPAIVVDFLYHPQAAIWFDHHTTTFKGKGWENKFKPSKLRALDPAQPSCCRLVLESLAKNFGWRPPRHLRELAGWLDIVDAANYKSARQTLERKEPALQIANFIDKHIYNQKLTVWLVGLLAERPLSEIARMPQVKKTSLAMEKEVRDSLKFFKKHIEIEKKTAFIDLSAAKFFFETARYISYYLHPKILYTVRINIKDHFYHMGVGVNPWRRKLNKINIGELMAKYGGGGHKNVGGVEFKKHKEAIRAAREIIKILNK